MALEIQKYDIGPCVVRMTARQAEEWNNGNADEKNMKGAEICIFLSHGGRSYVKDGEVVMIQGFTDTHWEPLWDCVKDEEFYEEYLSCELATLHEGF
jgi:hypothetical protein